MSQSPRIHTLNVNLFGGPGVGKSVTAASLFVALKLRGVHAELVTEFAKELNCKGTIHSTRQQDIIKEQYRRQNLWQGQAQVVVTDSPVPLSLVYAPPENLVELSEHIRELVAPWRNLNILLHRDLHQGYETAGRYQSMDEAIAFHHERLVPVLKDFYGEELIDCAVETAGQTLVERVVALLARP